MVSTSYPIGSGKRMMIIAMLVIFGLGPSLVLAQSDTLSPANKTKFDQFLNNFELIVYLDAYYNALIDKPNGDTTNVQPFASNCPFLDEFRLNVASVWFYYSAKNVRAKFELQFGDAPNLLSVPEAQFIKNMKQANLGFRVYKTLWVDIGYLYNPIGYESSFPVRNQISYVTVGGYYETGNFLGVKVSSQISPSVYLGGYIGNPYTLAYGRNTRLYGGLFFSYSLGDILSVNYNNMLGDASLSRDLPKNAYIYNNLYVTYNPVKNLLLVGQIDFAWMTNSSKPPDTTKAANMVSGFLQATYRFTNWFAASLRGEYFNDPNGALTTLYAYDGKLRGLLTYGGTVGVEFNPVRNSYLRAEYSYVSADKGNDVFNGNLRDYSNLLTFTAGLKFGFFK